MNRELTPDQMVTVKAMAPFELADIFAEWARRQADGNAGELGPLIPTWIPTTRDGSKVLVEGHHETPEEYGRRMAAGIITLLKEV